MIPPPTTLRDHLGEAKELALRMIDQIEWVDIADPPRGDDSVCRKLTEFVRRPSSREKLKHIIDGIAARMSASELVLRMVDPEEMVAAAGLLESAIKGLVKASSTGGAQLLAHHRIAYKLETLPVPWIEDPQQNPVAMAAALRRPLAPVANN